MAAAAPPPPPVPQFPLSIGFPPGSPSGSPPASNSPLDSLRIPPWILPGFPQDSPVDPAWIPTGFLWIPSGFPWIPPQVFPGFPQVSPLDPLRIPLDPLGFPLDPLGFPPWILPGFPQDSPGSPLRFPLDPLRFPLVSPSGFPWIPSGFPWIPSGFPPGSCLDSHRIPLDPLRFPLRIPPKVFPPPLCPRRFPWNHQGPPGIPPGWEPPGKAPQPGKRDRENPNLGRDFTSFVANPRIQSWDLGRIPPIQGFTAGLKPLTGLFWDGRGEIFPKSWILFPSGALRSLPTFPSFKSTFGRSKNPWKLNFPSLLGTQKSRQENFSFLPWIYPSIPTWNL
ncbi:uncharacterized protein ACIQIH_000126 [Cyanocitta cristata]